MEIGHLIFSIMLNKIFQNLLSSHLLVLHPPHSVVDLFVLLIAQVMLAISDLCLATLILWDDLWFVLLFY